MTTNPILPSPPANPNVPAITFRLILCLAALCSGVAGAQTLSSGGNFDGTILLGQTNTWTFTANVGDRIVLRGAALTSTNNFEPWLRIYNPGGVLIADSGINGTVLVDELALTATNSGTFTVLINDSNFGGLIGTGAYRLYFAQFPGTFVVPSGDEGGSLASGGNYDGTIQLGDMDLWSFTANVGDRVVLRGAALTSTNAFEPWLRIYGPNGVLIADSGVNGTVDVEELALTATNSGTYTVLMADTAFGGFDGTGAYRLYFAKLPGAFVVPSGDEGGSLANGGNYDGTIQLGDLDFWSFAANTGDRVVLRGAALTSTNVFEPWLRIYGPDGVLIADSGVNGTVDVEELALTATNSGTFTVLMADSNFGGLDGTGAYRLYFAQLPGAFVVPSGDEGGSLANGGNYDGTIQLGDLDFWSFAANTGDRVVLRGAALTSTNAFEPWLRIYGPNGVLIADSGVNGTVDVEELTLTATNSGTFTVLVADSAFSGFEGTGAYRLYFAQLPGVFVVPPGDEGGSLTNGGNYGGTIQLGDLDFWSFTANTGDRVVLRDAALTSTNAFEPWLRIYGPDGVLIADSGVNGTVLVDELALTATNSGTFTVLVADSAFGGFDGTGTYRLYVAHLPGALVVASGEEGGSLIAGVDSLGTIQLGDLDQWRFTACKGEAINLQMNELTTTNTFNPWLRLYGPNGVLIGDSGVNSSGTAAQVAVAATNGGTFTVIVTDSAFGGFDGTGTYRLSSNGLSDGLKLCFPTFPGTNVALAEVGGVAGATFVLFTQTNIAAAAALWTPIYTNQFDSFGVGSETNAFSRTERQRYFHLNPQ
jgi:WD40 repeat protein